MSIVPITIATYPNIPDVAGVPALLRSVEFPPTPDPPIARADSPAVTAQSQGAAQVQWGIFDTTTNKPVIIPQSIVAFEFRRDYSVPDYPIEDGGFASYNKVARPYEPRFSMSQGGTETDRQEFILAIEDLVSNLTLYNVVTPEYTWLNANLIHWDIRRTAEKGVSLLTIDVHLREIRVAPAPAFSNTKAVSGQSPNFGGTVQATEPTPQEMASAVHFN